MKRAHWFTRARVALRVCVLRISMRGQIAQIIDIVRGDGTVDAKRLAVICERLDATRAELRALGAMP